MGHTANNNSGKSAKTMDLKICIELGILRDKTINDKLIYIINKKENICRLKLKSLGTLKVYRPIRI